MTKYFLYISVLSIAILSSCTLNDIENGDTSITTDEVYTTSNEVIGASVEEGKAEFTINNEGNQVLEKEDLLLTNSSVNAVSYHWDFGNGDTSTEANPNYTYEKHGEYSVTLSITDRHNNTQEISHEIMVICLFEGQIHDDNG